MKKSWFRKYVHIGFLVVLIFGALGESYGKDLRGLGLEKGIAENAIGTELVKAWEGLYIESNVASLLVRNNIKVLEKAESLLASGIVSKVDLEFFVEGLNKLKIKNVSDADIEKIAEYAMEARKHTDQWAQKFGIESDVLGQVYKLADSPLYSNPDKLKDFLGETHLIQNVHENPGTLEQLNEAVRKLDEGKSIKLEGIDGDIVDLTEGLSFQYKAYNGTGTGNFRNNLKSAADQFNSEPTSLGKVSKLKVLDSSAPQYSSTSLQLRNKIQDILNGNIGTPTNVADNLRALTEIRVDNNLGLHRFEIINDIVFIID